MFICWWYNINCIVAKGLDDLCMEYSFIVELEHFEYIFPILLYLHYPLIYYFIYIYGEVYESDVVHIQGLYSYHHY